MSAEFEIRQVPAHDLSVLRDLAEETFLETFASQNEPGNIASYVAAAFSADHMAQEFATPGSAFYFIATQSIPVGYLKLNQGAAQTEQGLADALEIERIYVRSAAQGTGAGRALMQFAIETAKTTNKDWLWLGVWDQNAKAIEFYKRSGFIEFGQHDFHMGTELQRDLMMKLAIPQS